MIAESGQLFDWSEQTWLILDQIGILGGDFMLLVTTVGGAVAWFSRERIVRWFTRNRFPSVGGEVDMDADWDGLVFTVSNSVVPRWVLETLRPRYTGFVASETSRAAADDLVVHARELGIDTSPVRVIADPDDPADTRREILALLDLLRECGAGTLAVELTGGKTPMSLGAFMAAEECGADTLYVSSRYENGKPRMDTAGIRCISKPKGD